MRSTFCLPIKGLTASIYTWTAVGCLRSPIMLLFNLMRPVKWDPTWSTPGSAPLARSHSRRVSERGNGCRKRFNAHCLVPQRSTAWKPCARTASQSCETGIASENRKLRGVHGHRAREFLWVNRAKSLHDHASMPGYSLVSNLTCPIVLVVGVRGFEPPAPASRRQCSTRLSYTPIPWQNAIPDARNTVAGEASGQCNYSVTRRGSGSARWVCLRRDFLADAQYAMA